MTQVFKEVEIICKDLNGFNMSVTKFKEHSGEACQRAYKVFQMRRYIEQEQSIT